MVGTTQAPHFIPVGFPGKVEATVPLNWKDHGDGQYDALASRAVGGKYFIKWIEYWCFDDQVERRFFDVRYRYKGGGELNISGFNIRTLANAKALAETHHAKRKALIDKYGSERAIPPEAWNKARAE
jgi:hypothetical protein